MLIRQIELHNFLSHKRETITLSKQGMFFLSGKSGAGKSSTIIDAIAYALFGPNAVTRVKKHKELINSDTDEKEMFVKVAFQLGVHQLVVERGLSSKSSFARLYQAGLDGSQSVLIADGAKSTNIEISKRLGGMNWQQFYAAFVSRQQEISSLVTLKGSERKQTIYRMLGMRELEKASELLTKRNKTVKAEIDQINRSIGSVDLQEKKNCLSNDLKSKKEAEKAISISEKELNSITKENNSYTEKAKSLEVKMDNLERCKTLERDLIINNEKLSNLDKIYKNHIEAERILSSDDETLNKIKGLKEERETLRTSYIKRAEYDKIRKEIASLEDELFMIPAGGNSDLSFLIKNIADIEAEIKSSKAFVSESKDNLSRLLKDGICYVCLRKIDNTEEHKEANTDLLSKSIKRKYSEISELEEKLNILKNALPNVKKHNKISSEIKLLKESVKGSETIESINVLKKRGKEINDSLEVLEKNAIALEVSKKNLNYDVIKKHEVAKNRVISIKEELSKLSLPSDSEKESYNNYINKIKINSETIHELNSKIAIERHKFTTLSASIANQKNIIEGYEKEFSVLDKITDKSIIIDKASILLKGYQKHLAGEIKPALEEIGSEMINQVTNSKYTEMKIDDDYDVFLYEPKSDSLRSAHALSGGEQVRASICLRLALTRLVSQRTGVPVGFLVLDEPLPSQDTGHIEKIIELLDSLRPFYQQQFIISHVGNLRDSDSVDYVIEFDTDKEVNQISIYNS